MSICFRTLHMFCGALEVLGRHGADLLAHLGESRDGRRLRLLDRGLEFFDRDIGDADGLHSLMIRDASIFGDLLLGNEGTLTTYGSGGILIARRAIELFQQLAHSADSSRLDTISVRSTE